MQQYGMGGGAGEMMGGGGGGGAMVGQHGPKGAVRNGVMVLVYGLLSCGIYQMIWFMAVAKEMKEYLQRDEPDGMKILGLSIITCGVYYFYWALTRCGALIQEMQQRAGIANPTNPGIMLLIPYYNVIVMQEELNKVWQAPG
jgi:amino acid transporter